MKPADIKLALISIKLIGFLCIAFLVVTYAPHYAHHLLFILGGALIFLGANPLIKYKGQAKWVEKKGIIKSIREHEEEVSYRFIRVKYYYPAVEYEYMAKGAMHLGKTVSFEKENVWVCEVDNWGVPIPKEKRWWSSLKPGDEISVYVNPQDECMSVLIKDVTKLRRSHHLAVLASGIIISLIWLYLMKLIS